MLLLLSLFPALFLADTESDDASEDNDGLSLNGTADEDELTGGDGNDDIVGLLGGDILSGGAGDDVMQGGGGEDVMVGNEGNDFMQGRGQDDTVQGFSGTDWVDGNDGDDFVRGGSGDDVVIGGEGSDEIFGRNDDDILIGGEFIADPLTTEQLGALRGGGSLADIIPDSATVVDDGDADTLDGGNGNDVLLFGAGDLAIGGEGNDIFTVFADAAGSEAGTATVDDYASGEDAMLVYFQTEAEADAAEITVEDDGDDAVISVNGEALARVSGAAGTLTADQIEVAVADDDSPVENEPEPEVTDGTDGADEIDAGAGADVVNGGDGNDDILGGSGDDTLNGDGDADVIQGQGGFDEVNGNEGDDLLQGRGGNDSVSGNAGNDWVDGNDGDDLVNGGTEADTVIGGMGADIINGGDGADVLVAGEVLSAPLTTGELSNIRAGETLDEAIALDLGDSIQLVDDGSIDVLNGGDGADVLFFGAGDTATGGSGEDDFGIIATAANAAAPAIIADYDSAEDDVFIIDPAFDPDGAAPVVTVTDDGDDALILLNGELVGRVADAAGKLSAASISVGGPTDISVFDPNS